MTEHVEGRTWRMVGQEGNVEGGHVTGHRGGKFQNRRQGTDKMWQRFDRV